MTEKGMYFAKPNFYKLINQVGGIWNDKKERPIVCLIQSTEHPDLYWAIPVGNWEHRDNKAQQRILSYINEDNKELRSCFYHIGKTNIKSIFFISDVVPITIDYIDREYLTYGNHQYVIRNSNLIKELEYKLKRILKYENANPNFFRQHITDLKQYLLQELKGTPESKTLQSVSN